MSFDRITTDPNRMGGVPCIRGLRVAVATVIGMMSEMTAEEVLAELPDLEPEDIRQALAYAAAAVSERTLPPVAS